MERKIRTSEKGEFPKMKFVWLKKNKKAEEKRYVIVANNGNYLSYLSYRMDGNKLKEDTFWVVDIDNALKFTTLKFANAVMNYIGDCHIEEV